MKSKKHTYFFLCVGPEVVYVFHFIYFILLGVCFNIIFKIIYYKAYEFVYFSYFQGILTKMLREGEIKLVFFFLFSAMWFINLILFL